MYTVKIIKVSPIITEWEPRSYMISMCLSNFAMILRLNGRDREAVEVNSHFLVPPAYCILLASFNKSLLHSVSVFSPKFNTCCSFIGSSGVESRIQID